MSIVRFFKDKTSLEINKIEVKEIDSEFLNLKVLTKESLVDEWSRLCHLFNCCRNNTSLENAACIRRAMILLFPLWPISAIIAALWYLRDNYYNSEIDKARSKIILLTGKFIGEAQAYNKFLENYHCQLENLQKSLNLLVEAVNNTYSINCHRGLQIVTTTVTDLNALFKQQTSKAKRQFLPRPIEQVEGFEESLHPSPPFPFEIEEEPGLPRSLVAC